MGRTDYWLVYWTFSPLVIAVLFLCGAMVPYTVRSMMGANRAQSSEQFALEVLMQRLARGEISQTEYEERRRGLLHFAAPSDFRI